MIEGLKLKITHSELKGHCDGRSAYHSQRAEDKETSLPDIKRSLETLKGSGLASSISNMSKTSSYHCDPDDPIRDLERDIADHRNKSLVFKFFADHLFEDDYTLREEDLRRLEIIK